MRLNSKESMMIRAAEYYYEKQYSQSEIARILECSRSTVSRLITEAIESGIVQINIRRPVEKMQTLADDIKETFKLKEVIVVSGGNSSEQAFFNVSYATVELLTQILHDNMIIGISWGVTLSYLVQELSEHTFKYKGIEVIQLMGGLGFGDPAIDGPELAQKMAASLGGTYRYIQAPALLKTPELASHIMEERYILETLKRAEQAEVIISSVGSLMDNLSSMERSGYINKEDRAEYQAHGAIGHSLARLIDENGKEIDHIFNKRIVGVPLDLMQKVKWSIGIGANPLKANVFLAAIKGKQFNALVIDDGTAREILRLMDGETL